MISSQRTPHGFRFAVPSRFALRNQQNGASEDPSYRYKEVRQEKNLQRKRILPTKHVMSRVRVNVSF